MKQKEIENIAVQHEVHKSVIDKDWVLGHLLNSIYRHEALKEKLVFKGGTCLKKCYFENYRFSEDLDFTLIEPDFVIEQSMIANILDNTTEISGILFFIESFTETFSNDVKQGYEVIIKYWGADHKPNQAPLPVSRWTTSVKLDICFTEEILFPVDYHSIIHRFSDAALISSDKIPCYSLEEILSEKLRAVLQRNRPRDYMDIWYLIKNATFDWNGVLRGFKRKSEYKNIVHQNICVVLDDKKIRNIANHWDSSMGHQISKNIFPAPGEILLELKTIFEKIAC